MANNNFRIHIPAGLINPNFPAIIEIPANRFDRHDIIIDESNILYEQIRPTRHSSLQRLHNNITAMGDPSASIIQNRQLCVSRSEPLMHSSQRPIAGNPFRSQYNSPHQAVPQETRGSQLLSPATPYWHRSFASFNTPINMNHTLQRSLITNTTQTTPTSSRTGETYTLSPYSVDERTYTVLPVDSRTYTVDVMDELSYEFDEQDYFLDNLTSINRSSSLELIRTNSEIFSYDLSPITPCTLKEPFNDLHSNNPPQPNLTYELFHNQFRNNLRLNIIKTSQECNNTNNVLQEDLILANNDNTSLLDTGLIRNRSSNTERISFSAPPFERDRNSGFRYESIARSPLPSHEPNFISHNQRSSTSPTELQTSLPDCSFSTELP